MPATKPTAKKRTTKPKAPPVPSEPPALSLRAQTKKVQDYLDAIEVKSRPGRRVNPETLQRRLDELDESIPQSQGVDRLLLLQAHMDTEDRLKRALEAGNLDAAEAGFVACGREWAQRKGVSHRALRKYGVPPQVLREAGFDLT